MKRGKGFTLLELVIALAVITIISGGLFIVFRQTPRFALESASLQLQADISYVQRRAIAEGQRFRIVLSRVNNNYVVYSVSPGNIANVELRRVYLQNNVLLQMPCANNPTNLTHMIEFLPRGTVSGSTTTRLVNGRYEQDITIVPNGGRAYIQDIVVTNLRR